MLRPITLLTLAALAGAALPSEAQVYPERVRSVTRTVVRPTVERYQRDTDRATESERITRTFKLGANGDIDIGNIAGDITIIRGGGNDVVIEAIKTSRARTAEEAKAVLPLVEVDIERSRRPRRGSNPLPEERRQPAAQLAQHQRQRGVQRDGARPRADHRQHDLGQHLGQGHQGRPDARDHQRQRADWQRRPASRRRRRSPATSRSSTPPSTG